MRNLSKSRNDKYLKCKLWFKKHYIDKIPETYGPDAQRGSAVHECIRAYAHRCWEKGIQTDFDNVKQVVNDTLAKIPISQDIYDEAYEIMLEFASSHEFIPERIIAVEKWLEYPVGEYLFRGVVDLAEYEEATRTLIVTDYKSGRRIIKEEAVAQDFSLRGYAYLLKHTLTPKAENFVVRLDFVRYSVVVSAELDLTEIEKTALEIERFGKLIDSEKDFKPTPGFCLQCGYVDLCPVGKERVVTTDPVELGSLILVHEARLKWYREQMKQICENSVIPVNSEEFGYFTKNGRSADKQKVWDDLKAKGLNPLDYFNLDNRKAYKYLEDWEKREIVFRYLETEFKHRKIKNYILGGGYETEKPETA